MAHKLTGKNLETVALNVVEIKKHPTKKRGMYVRVEDASSGPEIKNRLMLAYTDANDYVKGLTWKDFTIMFPTVWQRDNAVSDATAAILEYKDSSYVDSPYSNPETDPTLTLTPDEDETQTDYTTYIIIGAAAAIIIALLLWQRK